MGALVAAIAVLFSTTAVFNTISAGAHTGDQSYLYLDVTATSLGGRVEMPFGDVSNVFGLDLDGDAAAVDRELSDNLAELIAYADTHLAVFSGGVELELAFDGFTLLELEEASSAQYLQLPFVAAFEGAEPPRDLTIEFDPFFDEIEGRDALLLIGNDWEGGVIENAEEVLIGFDANTRTRDIDLGNTSKLSIVTASVGLGLDHIRTGPDHIFFVLVLLLPSVLLVAGRFDPSKSFLGGLWRVLKIVTMFTLAHSVTFTLAGLDLIPSPGPKITETVIALSIAVAALNNLRPIAPNREPMIAFAFGLFHGLGFASLVAELDVSRGTQLLSLIGRNIGIEIGQTIVVLLSFPMLHLLRRTAYYRPFYITGSLMLAVVSSIWMVERIFEVDAGVNDLIDKLIKWPRAAVLALIMTIVAAGIYQIEGRRGRLRPLGGDDSPDVSAPASRPVTETV